MAQRDPSTAHGQESSREMIDFIHDHVPSLHRLPVASCVWFPCRANNPKARPMSASHHLLAQNLDGHIKAIKGLFL